MSTTNTQTKSDKLLSKIENRMLSTKKYKRTWWFIFFLTIFFFSLTIITLVFQYYPNHSETIKVSLQVHKTYALGAKVLVFISFGIISMPYLYLSGAWISGINNTSKSKYFHMFIWIIYSIAFLFVIIALILNFRSIMI